VTAGFGITVTRPRTGQWVVNHGRYDAAGYRTWRDAMAEADRRAQAKRQAFRRYSPRQGGQP
jgi:hypothetical protein